MIVLNNQQRLLGQKHYNNKCCDINKRSTTKATGQKDVTMLEVVKKDTMIRIPQYPEPAADGLDVHKDGYMVRKFIDNAAHQARVLPHQLETDDDNYVKSYHRFSRNEFYAYDIKVVRDKILDGLTANKKIHDDALKQLHQDLTWAYDEHADTLERCMDMVNENKRRVSELHTEVRNVMDGLFRS